MDNQLVLGYWNFRGIAQISRYLLAYTGANWTDKFYENRDEWFNKDKKNLGFAFPNLPYLIDGDLKITETSAIQRYIINRSSNKQLLGRDIRDQAIVDNLLGLLQDIRTAYAPLYFSDQYEEEVKKVAEKIEPKLKLLNNFYGDKEYALGYLTLPDFIIADAAYFIHQISQQLYQKYPFLDRTRLAFESLPQIQAYNQQSTAVKQFMSPAAKLAPKYF